MNRLDNLKHMVPCLYICSQATHLTSFKYTFACDPVYSSVKFRYTFHPIKGDFKEIYKMSKTLLHMFFLLAQKPIGYEIHIGIKQKNAKDHRQTELRYI